jgi:hypothetical protein
MEAFFKSEDASFSVYLADAPFLDSDLNKGLRSVLKNPSVDSRKADILSNRAYAFVEQEIRAAEVIVGFVDLILVYQTGEVVVIDHKFVSSKSSIPTEADALSDPQTAIYAKVAKEFFGASSLTFNYDYYGTKTMWSQSLNFQLTSEQIDTIWSATAQNAHNVLNNYKIVDLEEVEMRFSACGDFGGCPFSSICFGA